MLVQSWRDIRLSWDPSDFGGVHTLRTSANRIWLPDIRLYNASVQLPCFLLIARHNTDYGVWKGIKFVVCLFFSPGTGITATVQSICVNFCALVNLRPGGVFSPFGGDVLRGLHGQSQQHGLILGLSDTFKAL